MRQTVLAPPAAAEAARETAVRQARRAALTRRGLAGLAATIAAYSTMFVGMAWWSQRIYPVPYQWRRVVTAAAGGLALVALGKLTDAGLVLALALALVYPLVLLPLGFYLPAERKRIGARLRLAR